MCVCVCVCVDVRDIFSSPKVLAINSPNFLYVRQQLRAALWCYKIYIVTSVIYITAEVTYVTLPLQNKIPSLHPPKRRGRNLFKLRRQRVNQTRILTAIEMVHQGDN